MREWFSSLWWFTEAVAANYVFLASGGVLTVVVALIERHWLKRQISYKAELGVLGLFIFLACHAAWNKERKEVASLRHPDAPPSVVVNVPPAQIFTQEPKQNRDFYQPHTIPKPDPAPAPASDTSTDSFITDNQIAVAKRGLAGGAGYNVRLLVVGNVDQDYMNEVYSLFEKWKIESITVGNTNSKISKGITFVIPQPENISVQLAVKSFDRARINYQKDVDPSSYRGPISAGTPPALTVRISP